MSSGFKGSKVDYVQQHDNYLTTCFTGRNGKPNVLVLNKIITDVSSMKTAFILLLCLRDMPCFNFLEEGMDI
jgi:hypothetical protein